MFSSFYFMNGVFCSLTNWKLTVFMFDKGALPGPTDRLMDVTGQG